MGRPVKIVGRTTSAPELRAAAAETHDARAARRLLAVALALEGHSRGAAAEACGMDRQVLRDWIIRFNQGGIDALTNRPAPGRKPRLSGHQRDELCRIIVASRTAQAATGQPAACRLRSADIQQLIADRFGVQMHIATVGRLLGQLKLTKTRRQHVGAVPATSEPGFDEASLTSLPH